MHKLRIAAVAAGVLAMSGAAMAQFAVTATTELNIRSGPGPEHPVIGVISQDGQATLNGCLEGSRWCMVSHAGVEGWAYSQYLVADQAGVEVVVAERPAELAVPVVTFDGTATGGLAGAATGAIAGAIIAGPAGAAVGGIAGAAGGGLVGGLVDPTPEVRTYVRENPAEPVFLEGEVVVGASIPETVAVREIPNYQYRYVYVNNQPVLIEPDTRRIVYVFR